MTSATSVTHFHSATKVVTKVNAETGDRKEFRATLKKKYDQKKEQLEHLAFLWQQEYWDVSRCFF